MRITAISLVTLFVLHTFGLRGQVSATKSHIDSIVVIHPDHCDSITKKRSGMMTLGERPMRIANFKCKKGRFRIVLKGQITDISSKEGMPYCQIFLADSACSLRPLAQADSNGFFTISLSSASVKKSVYFTYLGCQDLELPLGKLRER